MSFKTSLSIFTGLVETVMLLLLSVPLLPSLLVGVAMGGFVRLTIARIK